MWDPSEYREGRNLGEYRRKTRVSTGKGTGKGWIRVSIGKGRVTASVRKVESRRVLRKGRIRSSFGK